MRISLIMVMFSSIVDDVLDDPNDLLSLCQAKCLLPESFWLVAADENAGVVVFGFDVLAQLVKRPVEVLFLSRQKHPARPSMKLAAVLFETRGGVSFGLDGDRHAAEC